MSNTPETQALFPVTPDFSRETLRTNIESILRNSRDVHTHSLTRMIMDVIPRAAPHSDSDVVDALQALFDDYKELADSGDAGFWSLEDTPVGKQALAALENARHRQSSSNAGGVDVDDLRRSADKFEEDARSEPRSVAVEIVDGIRGYTCEFAPSQREHEYWYDRIEALAARAALASLSTPTAEPMGQEAVDGLEWTEDGYSLRTPYDGDADGDGRPIIVGGEIVVTFSDSDEGDKYRERILRALTTPPTPDRIGKDAVREAEAWLRAISDWLLANDHDMTLPSGVLDKDPLDIADSLATLSATHAQPVDETERLRPMSEAPKDGRYVLARYKSLDGYALQLDGRIFAVRHEGLAPDGYDLGWALFPGHGGVPDKCFLGWMPMPAALQHKGEVSRG